MFNFNGEILSNSEKALSLDNRGFNYGDGLFESLRVVHNKIMFWEDHYFRLMASMRIMRMEIPKEFSPEFLENKILEVIAANNQEKEPARIKINVFRKAGGLYTPKTRDIGYCIRSSSLENAFYQLPQEKCTVELFKDHYVNAGLLSTLKSTNKAINVLAGIYASENKYENLLLLNHNKMVVEAINGNLFLVRDNHIKTPPLTDGCLNGIFRKKLIESLKKSEEYEFIEESISPFELQKADELLITNSIQGIIPISKYRKKEYTNTVAADLLKKINTLARLG